MKKVLAVLAGLLIMGSTVSMADEMGQGNMSEPQQENATAPVHDETPAAGPEMKKQAKKHHGHKHHAKHKHHHRHHTSN